MAGAGVADHTAATAREHGDKSWGSAVFLLCIQSETPAGKWMLPALGGGGQGFTPQLAQSFIEQAPGLFP